MALVTKSTGEFLKLQDLAASQVVSHHLTMKGDVIPPIADAANQVLMTRWMALKANEITSQFLAPMMMRIEKEVANLNPDKKETLENKVTELFFRLAKQCDIQSYFGGIIPVTPEPYTHLYPKWKDEALLAFWEEIRRLLGVLLGAAGPQLTEPQKIRAWLADPANAPQLTNIRILSLSNSKLRVIPPEIGFCTQLQVLFLSDNQISSIPPEIGLCAQLQQLFLQNNQISSIPPEIGSCTQLQYFDLYNNQISSIPPEIGSCTQLKRLYFWNNQISSIPREIGSCTQLEQLFLQNNQISSIPPEIGLCSQLKTLNLTNNQISSIPPEIRSCDQMLWLCLADNPVLFISHLDLPTSNLLSDILKSLDVFKSYTCLSSLSAFLKILTFEEGVGENIQRAFSQLKKQDQCLIFEMICQESDTSSKDLRWGEQHLFDNPVLLRRAVKKAISAKFDRLSPEDQSKVHDKICHLAGPEALWVYNCAFKEVLMLVDAMDLVGV
jgi:Leucine-rich repeat (LRR) protein